MSIKVGLFGAGRIGEVHARSIAANPNSELVAITDVRPDAATLLAEKFHVECQTSSQILDDRSIEAILIASSTDTHVDLILAGVKAGKAVFCEKPVDLDLKQAVRCLEVARNATRPIMIGFNRRFDPNFEHLKTAYEANEIGKGELLTITSFDPAPPPLSYIQVSGGLFRDMAIHDFDMACWLFGDVPETVCATGACLVDPEIGKSGDIDTAITTLQFADGRIANIKNSRRAVYGYDQRIELLGAHGMLVAENVLENTVTKSTADGVVSAKPEYFFLERYMRSYGIGWSRFVEAVMQGGRPPVSLEDGVVALAIAEAASVSMKQDQTIYLAEFLPQGSANA